MDLSDDDIAKIVELTAARVIELLQPPPKLMSRREAAKVLGVHHLFLFHAAKKGEIPCVRVGNRMRFDVEDLRRFMKDRQNLPPRIGLHDAANLLGMDPRTLKDRVLKGQIPGVQKGHRWFFDREVIEAHRRG